MRIVLLGAPGSGKGTQAARLQAKHGVPQVSSGDLLRDAVARKTDLGLQAKAVMEAGQLVSDDIVLGLIRDRLSRPDAAKGFILDGFPRNIDQANSLAALLNDIGQPLEAVLLLDVSKNLLLQRLAGRRICPKCGAVYNVMSMPAGATGCSNDGAELYQRPDDKEEVIGKRLEVYEAQTRPLIQHYTKLGLLRAVAGEGELDDVFERLEAAALAKSVPAGKVSVRASKQDEPALGGISSAKAVSAKPVTAKAAPTKKKAAKSPLRKAAKVAKQSVRKGAKKVAAKAAKPAKQAAKKKVVRSKSAKKSSPRKSKPPAAKKSAAKKKSKVAARKK